LQKIALLGCIASLPARLRRIHVKSFLLQGQDIFPGNSPILSPGKATGKLAIVSVKKKFKKTIDSMHLSSFNGHQLSALA